MLGSQRYFLAFGVFFVDFFAGASFFAGAAFFAVFLLVAILKLL